jgi:hypothetical protein
MGSCRIVMDTLSSIKMWQALICCRRRHTATELEADYPKNLSANLIHPNFQSCSGQDMLLRPGYDDTELLGRASSSKL